MINVEEQEANTDILLLDISGAELLSWTTEKTYSSIIVSCPEIKEGETYLVKAGAAEQSIAMDSLIYGSGSPAGKVPGGNGGERGGMKKDGMHGGPVKGRDPGDMENTPPDAP